MPPYAAGNLSGKRVIAPIPGGTAWLLAVVSLPVLEYACNSKASR